MNLDAIQLNANVNLAAPRGAGQPVRQESVLPSNPFVGLRPFESEESVLFFGRDQQIVELLQQLHRTRFLAVVGSSGCGKSSLIRAGLIPKLKAGFLVERRERWNVITLKPGDSPLRNLAHVVLGAASEEPTAETVAELVKKMRVEGAEAVVSQVAARLNEADANLLLLVDQFEEIFRFVLSEALDERQQAAVGDAAAEGGEAGAAVAAGKQRRSDEAARFVSIILELSRQRTLPVYVVLTMRSDFISDYDLFNGLPEAVNGNLYLVPRLNRQQYQEAVKGPVRLYGREITPRLLDRVVNDLGGEPDQLPVMQHALMRTWENCSKREHEDSLDLPQYEAAGTIKNALSWDADTAMKELAEDEPEIAERLFQALVDTDIHGRRVRRPVHLSEVEEITGAPPEKILDVVGHFRREGRCFLVLSSERIEDDPLIDISHESFIRRWDRLRKWVEEENESKEIYTHLADAALRYEARRGRLWGEDDPDLQQALDWWEKRKPNEAWAVRYHPAFKAASDFLQASEEQREKDRAAKESQRLKELESEKIKRQNARLRRFTYALILISMLAVAGSGATVYSFAQARRSESQAMSSARLAEERAEQARQLAQELESSLQEAQNAREDTEKQRQLAEDAADKAEDERKRAQAEKVRADQEAAEAVDAREKLKVAKDNQERDLIEARRKLLGDLGGLYRQAILLSRESEKQKEATAALENIYALYENNGSREGKVSTLFLLANINKPTFNPFDPDTQPVQKTLDYFSRLVKELDANNAAEKAQKVSALVEMGNLLYMSDRKKTSQVVTYYEQALKIGGGTLNESEDPETVFERLGDAYSESSDRAQWPRAIEYYNRAITILDAKIKKNENPDNYEVFTVDLSNIIKLHTMLGQEGEAERAYQRLIEVMSEGKKEWSYKEEARVLINIGVSLDSPVGKQKRAKFFDRALELYRKNNDTEGLAVTNVNIGLRLQDNDPQDALPYLQEAVRLRRDILKDKKYEAEALQTLGDTYLKLGKRSEAIKSYRDALKIYKEIGFYSSSLEDKIKFAEGSPQP